MRKKARLKQLTLGIAAALLAGSWQAPAWAAEEGPITENKTLTEDTTVKVVEKGEEIPKAPAGVYANQPLTLDMAGHDLNLHLDLKDLKGRKAPSTRGSGIFIQSKSSLTIHSDKANPHAENRLITINARGGWLDAGSTGGATSGIYFKDWARGPMNAEIQADVTVEQLWSGREPARGIWAPGQATLDLKGKFTIKPDGIYHYYTEAPNGSNKKAPGAYGIHVEGKNNNIKIRSVDITATRIQRGIQFGGDFDAATKSTVRIGGGTFKVKENAARDHRLMYLKGTSKSENTNRIYFNTNEDGTDAGTQTTDLEGFIDVEKNGEVYLGLSDALSKWLGGTKHDAQGKTTLFLKNGATWDTTNSGRGTRLARLSSVDGTAGHIFQNDTGKLTIDDYAGRQNIYYSHAGGDGTDTSHYKAGDTHIVKAAANSFVTMVTDRASTTTTDEKIHQTLNALAGKLYYDEAKSGQKNLKGKAVLAEELTASSAALSLHSEEIAFDAGSGKGSTTASIVRDRQIAEAGWPSMDITDQWDAEGYRHDEGKNYTFDKDVVIRTKASGRDDKVIPAQRYYKGGIIVDEEDEKRLVTINMNGHRLTLNSTADMPELKQKHACGIISTGTKLEIQNAGGIDINITGNGTSRHGIYAFTTSRKDGGVTIKNDDAPEHAVKIRNTASGEKGDAVVANATSLKKTVVDIQGLVDIEQDKENLLYVTNAGEIHIGGGRIVAGAGARAAKLTGNGKVFINTHSGGSGVQAISKKRDVQIEGNVVLDGNNVTFGAALATKNSYFKGKIGRGSGSGNTALQLANGARWDNQSVGLDGNRINTSYLSHLKSDDGAIYQNDAKDIRIDKFEGKAKLFYAHENDGTDAAHYKAGNTHIKSAEPNAEITVATDSKNVKMTDEQELYKTLNALAGKLYYDSAATESNLKGKAMIAEGLTSSAASQKLEDIIFKKDAGGQGSVKAPVVVEKNQIAEIGAASTALTNAWKASGERDATGKYTFNKALTLNTKANGSGLLSMGNHIGSVLMNSEGAPSGSKINMQTFKLTLHTENNTDAAKRAVGIGVVGTDLAVEEAGAVDISIRGDKDSASGIYAAATAEKNAAVRIRNGNAKEYAVKIRNESSGAKKAAITAKGEAAKEALVEVTGLVDIEQDKDNLLYAADGGVIRIGGGSMKAAGDAKAVHIKNNGKTLINATEEGDSVEAASTERDAKIEGNVLLEGNDGVFGAALATKDSYIKGKIGGTGSGSTRLLLAKGAYWDNKSVGSGGDTIGKSHLTHLKSDGGSIYQNDAKDITIDKFAGKATLFYHHTNDGTAGSHYTAGDTHIKSAAPDAEITVATDQTNVDLTDDAKVYKTLDALAGKLYYDGYVNNERTLKGKAMIAEGLTASSASKKIEKITFKENGQGSVKEEIGPGRQIAEGAWTGAELEQRYWKKQGVRSGSTYTLNKDVTLAVKRTDNPVKALNDADRYDFGGILWGKGRRGSIEMKGHALNIDVGSGNLRTQAGKLRGDESTGILVSGGTLELKSLGKTSIKAQNNGIHLLGDADKGNAELFVHNGAAADPAVTIRSEDKGIYLESTTGAANLDIKGKVDIEAPQGVVVDRGKLTIGGGRIVSKGEAALYVNSISTAKINAKTDSEGNIVPVDESRDVQIEGDIRVKDSSASAYLGLTTKNSFLKGLFTTDMYTWPLHQWEWASGKGYLVLKNGATWEHIKVGTGMDKNGKAELGDSRVNRLNADGGIIRQKDKRNILIDDFRGKMQVMYEHENDGSRATDYKAGDVKIAAAKQGSEVTMVTDSNGIKLNDEAQVRSVLDALAGKLYYTGVTAHPTNLKGTAMIAEGFVTSSVSKKVADIAFRSTGQGYTENILENGNYKSFHGVNTGIDRNDHKALTFDNFSGSARLYYKHVNDGTRTEDYGSDPTYVDPSKRYHDTHIKHAAENSSVTMVTDSNGVELGNENAVRKTLNALAGKLYYDGYAKGERNLKGTAMIAEGLTGSAISQQLDLDYRESDGRAHVKSNATSSTASGTIQKQIAEGNYDDVEPVQEFWKKKGVYDGNGNYTFHHDIKLEVKAADKPVISVKDNKFGTIYWNGDVKGSIDMTGHRLDIKAGPGGHGLFPNQGPQSGWERTPNAITVYSGTLTIKNVKGMNIESDPKGSLYGRGIFVMGYPGGAGHNSGHGHAKLVIENDDKPENAVKIRVKDTGEDFGAIEARKNMGSAEVDIKGLVDIDSKMWRAVESHGARVSIGGGTIKGSDVASIAAYDNGTVFVNAQLNNKGHVVATSKTRPVKITGDISSESNGHVVLGLNNKESFFKGLVSTDIWGVDKATQKPYSYIPGSVSMLLANGATWEHKQVGTGYYTSSSKDKGAKARGKGNSMDSHVTRLQADKGVLKQNDPHKITIDNYSGNMQLVYQHEGDGTKAENYKAGDVHIKKAEKDSAVTMVTDGNGLSLTDETQVYKTLNALAGKLYYDGYKTGERNLKGAATISEGLTESSKTLKKANMDWSETSGQGSVKAPQKPGTDPQKPGTDPQKPGTDPQKPGTDPQKPGTDPQKPGTDPQKPGTDPQKPGKDPQKPGTDPQKPGKDPQKPGKDPQKPGTNPQKPKIEYGDYETKLMSGVKSAMTASTMAWRAEANDLMKRMGDLRLSPEDEGVWARVYRGKSSSNKDKTNFEMNYTTIQVGYDKKVGDDWRVGVAGSYMKGSSSYASGSGENKEGNLGVYGTWTGKSGEYVDLIAKIGRLANEYTVYNDFGHYVKGDFHTWGGSLSAEYGRRISLKGGSFVEPQIELIYSHLNGVNYTGDTDYVGRKMHVRQGAMNSFVSRLGVGFGQETERGTWFLKASLYHEFAGDISTEYTDGFTPKSTTQRGKDTWVGIQLGGTTRLNDRTSLYGTFEKTFGGDIKTDWRIDAGLRWSF